MTREQLQQVREALELTYRKTNIHLNAVAIIALIDAELEKPETDTWQRLEQWLSDGWGRSVSYLNCDPVTRIWFCTLRQGAMFAGSTQWHGDGHSIELAVSAALDAAEGKK